MMKHHGFWLISCFVIISIFTFSILKVKNTDSTYLISSISIQKYDITNSKIDSFAIAYTITPEYFHLIMVSIFSIAQVKKSDILINIYVFILSDLNPADCIKNELNMVKNLSAKLRIQIIKVNPLSLESRFNFQIIKIKPIIMLRLLMHEMLQEKYILYLDSEVIAGNDFYPHILSFLKTSHTIYGVEDLGIQKYDHLRKILVQQKMDARFYINAGIFFFKNGPNAEKLFSAARKFANSNRLIYSDQDAINNLGPDNIGLLPYVFNCRTGLINERGDCIFHHDTALPTNKLWKKVESEFYESLKAFEHRR